MNSNDYQQNHKTPSRLPKQLKPVKGKVIEDNRPQFAVQKKANNTGLPGQLKSGIENLSGISMNDVQVKYNSPKPAQLQAHAYAQGNEIHLAPGQEKQLPHEAWHVVQQKQGRVKPTLQMKKGNIKINDEKHLESEADTMGKKAIQMKVEPGALKNKPLAGGGIVAQLSTWRWDANNDVWIPIKTDIGEAPPDFEGGYDGEIYDDEPKSRKRKKDDDQTFKGARTFGNSSRLAKSKYNQSSKKPHVNFKKWREGREAQHIIPASLAKKRKPLQNIIDNVENAIMLPAQLDQNNTKVTHRKPNYRDHAKYSNNVARLIREVLKTGLGNNQATMIKIMHVLRPVNKLVDDYNYLDDIPYSEFKDSWNKKYGKKYGI